MGSRIYVTGMAGFLGSHLAEALLAAGHTVRGCDNLLGGEPANVPPGAELDLLDCADVAGMKAATAGTDVLFHCAATAYEGLSVFSPAFVCQNVFQASVATFTAAIDNGVRRIVLCSSMARYGAGAPPFREDAPAAPVDPYGVAKLAAEDVLRTLSRLHGIEYTIAVPHNIYGPRQRYDDPYRNVAAIMANRLLQGLPAIVYGDGRQRRCFTYVDDAVVCLVRMATSARVVGEVVNIGPDDEFVEVRQLAEMLGELTGCREPPLWHAPRPGEVHAANCDADKARRLLGFEPRTPLRAGLARLVEHIRARGPRPFRYDLPIEIDTPALPDTWRHRLI